MRILIAGFQHETNTFAPSRAEFHDFQIADSWPALLEGEAVLRDTMGMNLPITGAIQAAVDFDLIPVLWCAAEPSGYVRNDAYDTIVTKILEGVRAAGTIDGIYLDLHGAMVTEEFEDGEGELLRQLRKVVGSELPIGVSLDSHANITPLMVEHATLITVYRTYPHLDMADTGYRCMNALKAAITGQSIACAYRQLPFLIPLHAQYTGQDPAQRLYALLKKMDKGATRWVEFALGFTAADIYHCGPALVAFAESKEAAEGLVDILFEEVIAAKTEFVTETGSDQEVVGDVMNLLQSESPEKPVVIADIQDNPGAGGTSDTTGILKALIEQSATHTVLGVMYDREIAGMAHRHRVGDSIHAQLGAKSGLVNQTPVGAEYKILALSDGRIPYTGEMYGGSIAELGLSCLLAVQHADVDIQIVVSSQRIQCLDQALFKHFGVDLWRKKIIVVKSTVHFQADFKPIASHIINAISPGVFSCQLDRSHYQKLRPDVKCL